MKKTLLLLLISFASFASFAQPQISNYSFEDWTNRYGKTAPTGWQVDSISVVNNLIKKVTPGTQGTYAIQINTAKVGTEIAGALIQRDDSLMVTPGDLSFDYKVVNTGASEFNGLQIDIYFKDSKKKDLRDFHWSSSGVSTNFVNGKMNISFKAGEVPKYYTLIITYFNLGGLAGEYTIVDNLKFSAAGSVNTLSGSSVLAFPNPAVNTINFTHEPMDKLHKVRLVSLDGKVSEYIITDSSIDISSLNRGIYVLELYNSENQIIKREKLSVVN